MVIDKMSRRERQIIEIVFRLKEASVRGVMAEMPDPPSYSAVRSTMNILQQKGYLHHRSEGKKFIYSAVKSSGQEGSSILRRAVNNFFGGSVHAAAAALIGGSADKMTEDEYQKLIEVIEKSRDKRDGK